MDKKDYIEANKIAWEETAIVHKNIKFDELLKNFSKPGYVLQDQIEKKIFTEQLQVVGKDVIQLCCNNGREILSVKNLGANRCVGIDLTEGFIKQGQELAKVAKQEIELYSMDVYAIPESFHYSFDIVYITIGAITWLPDLYKFMAIISKLLRKGGHLFIYEMHPILYVYDLSKPDPIIPKIDYFTTEPYVEKDSEDYYDTTKIISAPMYSFQHTLSEIFSSCIKNNLQIVEFTEHPHDISIVFKILEEYKLPKSYTLLAKK